MSPEQGHPSERARPLDPFERALSRRLRRITRVEPPTAARERVTEIVRAYGELRKPTAR